MHSVFITKDMKRKRDGDGAKENQLKARLLFIQFSFHQVQNVEKAVKKVNTESNFETIWACGGHKENRTHNQDKKPSWAVFKKYSPGISVY